MAQLFFASLKDEPSTVFKISQNDVEQLTDHFVWEVDDTIFPLENVEEIQNYFFDLKNNSKSTRILPGFDLIKT